MVTHKWTRWSPWTQSTTKQASAILFAFPWQPINICTGRWRQLFISMNCRITFFFCRPSFFRLWAETGICLYFILFYFSMPSFTKAKTFAKCPWIYKICCFFFAVSITFYCILFFTIFYLLCNGCRGLPTALHLPPLKLNTSPAKKKSTRSKIKTKTDH